MIPGAVAATFHPFALSTTGHRINGIRSDSIFFNVDPTLILWDVGGLDYRLSSLSHAGLVTDLIDHLLPNGRQLKSNAHPLIEMTLMNQPKHDPTIVHS